jgi:hypothetical protein
MIDSVLKSMTGNGRDRCPPERNEDGMAEPRRALVMHLTSGGEPLLMAVPEDSAVALAGQLPDMLRRGDVETITTSNGTVIAVNFAHVVTAHIDTAPGLSQMYGSLPRER